MMKDTRLKLSDYLAVKQDGKDYGDMDFDMAIHIEWYGYEEESDDYYTRCCRLLTEMLEITSKKSYCGRYRHGEIVDFSGFIKKHMSVFEEFTKNCSFNMSEYDEEDDKIEVGINTLEGLFVGNFNEDSYKELYEILIKKKRGNQYDAEKSL